MNDRDTISAAMRLLRRRRTSMMSAADRSALASHAAHARHNAKTPEQRSAEARHRWRVRRERAAERE